MGGRAKTSHETALGICPRGHSLLIYAPTFKPEPLVTVLGSTLAGRRPQIDKNETLYLCHFVRALLSLFALEDRSFMAGAAEISSPDPWVAPDQTMRRDVVVAICFGRRGSQGLRSLENRGFWVCSSPFPRRQESLLQGQFGGENLGLPIGM